MMNVVSSITEEKQKIILQLNQALLKIKEMEYSLDISSSKDQENYLFL